MLELREPTVGPRPPRPEEMAAIAAVVEELWPRPSVEEDISDTAETVWKFANRWWQGHGVLQRGRPRRPSSFS